MIHTFILGPSGSGKSVVASHLAQSDNLLWLELDLCVEGTAHHGFRTEWEDFLDNARPEPLASKLDALAAPAEKRAVVLSFPGYPIFEPCHMRAARNHFRIAYLTGTKDQCLQAFLDREAQNGRHLPREYWEKCSESFFEFLRFSAVPTTCIPAFASNGNRRSLGDICDDVRCVA